MWHTKAQSEDRLRCKQSFWRFGTWRSIQLWKIRIRDTFFNLIPQLPLCHLLAASDTLLQKTRRVFTCNWHHFRKRFGTILQKCLKLSIAMPGSLAQNFSDTRMRQNSISVWAVPQRPDICLRDCNVPGHFFNSSRAIDDSFLQNIVCTDHIETSSHNTLTLALHYHNEGLQIKHLKFFGSSLSGSNVPFLQYLTNNNRRRHSLSIPSLGFCPRRNKH